jgi:hypothetical protein
MITITKVDGSTAEYAQYRVSGDKADFIGPDASDAHSDLVSVKSIAPKRGNGQYGNRRSTLSIIRGTSVLDLEGQSVVRDRKFAVETSIPVGTTEEDLLEDAYNLGSLLQNATFVKKLIGQGIIEH